MDHQDHVHLLENGVRSGGGVWADFGSGRGAFTLALAELIGPEGTIYSVDKNRRALGAQERRMEGRFPELTVRYIPADFRSPVELPPLDGLVIANALHFMRDKAPVVDRLQGYLRPQGRFILVEYNTDRGNPWVPHPISYASWVELAAQVGFSRTRKLAAVPSSFLGEIYAAASVKRGEVE